MKVLFAHKKHPIEPLGVGYLASSIARGGHESRLELTSRDINEAVAHMSSVIDEYKPNIFAQSIIFGSHGYSIELNKRLAEKYPNLVSVLGGPAATFTPELIDRGFDAICRYEGENPFLEFCNALEKGEDIGNIPNIWIKANPNKYFTKIRELKKITDIDNPQYVNESGFDAERMRFVNATRSLLQDEALNAIPFPDRKLLYSQRTFAEGPIKHFMLTRGCAFHCTYCHVEMQNIQNKGKGKVVRLRDYESFVNEVNQVQELCSKRGLPFELVYLQDDIMGPTYRIDWAREFADISSSELGMSIHGHVRFDLINDDIAKALSEAGVTGVHVAIESGDEHIRNDIHRRGMTDKQVIEGSASLRKYGIKMMTQNILGALEENRQTMYKTLEMNIAVKPTYASAAIFQPFPGTSALERAKETGVMPTKDVNKLIDLFGMETFYNHSILANDPKEKRWMEVFQKFFAIAVENPEIYHSGKLEKMMEPYLASNNGDDEELREMYRAHRAKKDEELYGVKLTNIVDKDEE